LNSARLADLRASAGLGQPGPGGAGFAEFAQAILADRAGRDRYQ